MAQLQAVFDVNFGDGKNIQFMNHIFIEAYLVDSSDREAKL